MNKGLFFRVVLCIFFFGGCLYSYINMQNEITELRIRIPELSQSVRRIQEENTRLHYEIEAFESPDNLIRIAQKNAFAYLKYPTNQEVVTMRNASILLNEEKASPVSKKRQPSITFASGGKP